MPPKTINQLNEGLFVLRRHGLNEADLIRWLRQNKSKTNFHLSTIRQFRNSLHANDRQAELIAGLNQMLDVLKAKQLFFDADASPSGAQRKRIRKLLKLDGEEPELDPKTRRRLLIITIVGALLYFGGRQVFMRNSSNCSKDRPTAVQVAEFQNNGADPFSESVVIALRRDLDPASYAVGKKSYQSLDDPKYYDRIQDDHFGSACDRGLFLCGLWNKPDSAFMAYILLYRLAIKTPGLKYGDYIFLENPPEIRFSIRDDAQFLTTFVKGILKTYDDQIEEALVIFRELESRQSVLEQDQTRSIKGYIALFKGQCYAREKQWDQALEEYRMASTASGVDIKAVAQANLKTLAEMLGREIEEDLTAQTDSTAFEDVAESLIPYPSGSGEDPNQGPIWESDVVVDQAGNQYRTISLPGGTWMRDNLRVDVDSSWCYNNDPAKCAQYGRLYTWPAAKTACEALGSGWRLPTNEEWQKLGDAFNGFYDFMNFDKELRVPRRLNASITETNSAPERSAELDQRSYFWSASKPPSDSGKDRALYYQFDGGEHTLGSGQTDKRIALFCRCVKGN